MAGDLLLARPAGDVLRNCRVKIYPDGSVAEVLACSTAVFRPAGWEPAEEIADDALARRGSSGSGADAGRDRSRRRARQHLRDLLLCNPDLDVMWTLTVAPGARTERGGQAIGRTDCAAITRKLQQWLADRVRRRGLRYVAVYEQHQRLEADGLHAIHVHGVSQHSALKMVDSGHRYMDAGGHWHRVYNLADWPLGITTALYLYGDRGRAASYVSKYISKSDRPVAGRWYMHSRNLATPRYAYIDIDYARAPGHVVRVPEARCAYKYIAPADLADLAGCCGV